MKNIDWNIRKYRLLSYKSSVHPMYDIIADVWPLGHISKPYKYIMIRWNVAFAGLSMVKCLVSTNRLSSLVRAPENKSINENNKMWAINAFGPNVMANKWPILWLLIVDNRSGDKNNINISNVLYLNWIIIVNIRIDMKLGIKSIIHLTR